LTDVDLEQESPAPTLRILRWVPIVIVLGLVVHFVLPRLAAIEGALQTARTMRPWAIALAVLAEFISYLANGSVLQSVIAVARERISLRRATAIELAAGSVSIVAAGALGFGAAILRWTRRGGVSRDAAMLASWLPSIFDAAALIVFALLSAIELLLAHQLSRTTMTALAIVVTLLSAVIVAGFVFLARNDWMVALARRLTKLMKKVRPSADDRILLDAADRAGNAWQSLKHGGWMRPAISSFGVLAFDLLCLDCVFLAAGQHVHLPLLIAGYGVPILLGRASLLPGGIAVIEVAMAALYSGLGVPPNIAVVAVLVYRLISFWLPAVIGIPIAIALQSKWSTREDDHPHMQSRQP
jgi:uncharacterized protein (TIRG00374 family)